MKIAIGCEHVEITLKQYITVILKEKNIEVIESATISIERADGSIYAKSVAKVVTEKQIELGILICGTVVAFLLMSIIIVG